MAAKRPAEEATKKSTDRDRKISTSGKRGEKPKGRGGKREESSDSSSSQDEAAKKK